VEELKKKYSSPINLLTSLSSQKFVAFMLLGLILIGIGVFLFKSGVFESQNSIEIINTDQDQKNEEITVEIAGSVEKPGVYKLPNLSRVDDLLVACGGLSGDADREWVTKNINRASKLSDGQKIYIYSQSEVESAKKNGGSQEIKGVSSSVLANDSELININTASQEELESLVGIGPVYAQKIIEGRNYSSLEELVNRKIIPQKTFDKIKNEISVY
jgi:competence protein ComEA